MIDELHIFGGMFLGLTFVNIFSRLNQFLDIKKTTTDFSFFSIIDRHNISLMNKRIEYNR